MEINKEMKLQIMNGFENMNFVYNQYQEEIKLNKALLALEFTNDEMADIVVYDISELPYMDNQDEFYEWIDENCDDEANYEINRFDFIKH